ncbi:carboxyvinyl-carboxyphosphonate phosphorylmutase [Burkholderia stagnalis]|uniref:isocitrate lyase/PEP mutase family protein n=1 Tax=Burkholderia stagnalis TaxID=1503054 RepID=UPI00075C5104|nr:isocitrate lyase/phosphoenolpyruvate mutase family protein [Burkholderia stagnalis]KVD89277.1 carboxyvinyl-carboxyphosphonate phosphorylmutase [Burkholderia stagnalis]KVO61204.1 carboxyvinyl-carboxyphosphonate phosphorylmutase [Burkholderia stagnalis]KVP12810.1 carboxyvinyl-carboxyphosphonate phosphorylmutase [Burkholderia stagnalis]KVW96318.1 carboxyvinyl-carboxyphosphonate phosphorylmutase [Burkholderia stagnalis]KWH75441.1 carboxyvinyl-carboxyphosphonate phosphorylmutase [Burkholderia st
MTFAQLHQQSEPLLLANVWDAASARVAEAAGYAALGTSSAAIADLLGYADGEEVSFAELKALVARLGSVSDLPLTVDVEAGYGATPEAVVANLRELAALGVAGVNLEDSVVRDGRRTLVDADTFARRLHDINTGLLASGVELFLNVRTDTFLSGVAHAREETLARGRRYEENGANGLFVPCVTDEADIAAIVSGISLPLNVMCMPNLPAFERLAALGVKRVSMGNFLHQRALRALQQLFLDVRASQSFKPVFDHASH